MYILTESVPERFGRTSTVSQPSELSVVYNLHTFELAISQGRSLYADVTPETSKQNSHGHQ